MNSDDVYVSDDIIDSIVQNFSTQPSGSAFNTMDSDKLSVTDGSTNDVNGNGRTTPLLSKKRRVCQVLNDKTAQNLCKTFFLSCFKMFLRNKITNFILLKVLYLAH